MGAASSHRIGIALGPLTARPISRAGSATGTREERVLRMPDLIAYALSEEAITVLSTIHGRREWTGGPWPGA